MRAVTKMRDSGGSKYLMATKSVTTVARSPPTPSGSGRASWPLSDQCSFILSLTPLQTKAMLSSWSLRETPSTETASGNVLPLEHSVGAVNDCVRRTDKKQSIDGPNAALSPFGSMSERIVALRSAAARAR